MSFAGQNPDQYIEQKIIEPLLAFRHKVRPLNQIHNDCMQQFTRIMMGLLLGLDGETAFQGPGANALAELVGQFLDGERKLCGTDPLILDGRLQDAAVICERHAYQLQHYLQGKPKKVFIPSSLLADVGGGNSDVADPVADETTGTFLEYQSAMRSGPNIEPLGQTPDLNGMPTASTEGSIGELTPLPGNNPAFLKSLGILGITAGGAAVLITGALVISALTPNQQQEVRDIIAQMTNTGYAVDQSEVEALVSAGYDKRAILAILKTASVQDSEGQRYYVPTGYAVIAHAIANHVAKPDSELRDRASKSKAAGGAQAATSFYGLSTAQSAVNFAIASSSDFQSFIEAAVPNTAKTERVCDPGMDFGYGYIKVVGRGGRILAPRKVEHLHCVSVTIAIDAFGKAYVLDAYPTE